MQDWPELCRTCNQPYKKVEICICSNVFHCCRDCMWINGQVTDPCEYHKTEWKKHTYILWISNASKGFSETIRRFKADTEQEVSVAVSFEFDKGNNTDVYDVDDPVDMESLGKRVAEYVFFGNQLRFE